MLSVWYILPPRATLKWAQCRHAITRYICLDFPALVFPTPLSISNQLSTGLSIILNYQWSVGICSCHCSLSTNASWLPLECQLWKNSMTRAGLDYSELIMFLCWPPLAVNEMRRSGVRPPVCPIFILTLTGRRILNVTHQGAANDADSEYFRRERTYLFIFGSFVFFLLRFSVME